MGKVYLVGAGPGDPELITLKGRRLLAQADCVLYDNLANPELLALAPRGAECIYVGKKKSAHAMSQDEICRLLVDRGQKGLNVVRLKGGDPYLFGRGGEEAEALYMAGVDFEVVPGVSTPLGIAAYSGVPLTHREHTSVVTFVTGHDVAKIDWTKVGTAETLVIFMGLSFFDDIARAIIEAGRSPDTPAMVVRWGTRPDQSTLIGTLGTLPAMVHARDLKPPATFIVGEVVELRTKLNWFERLPLFGQTIVVTRAREQAEGLTEALRHLGAHVLELPAIEIHPPKDPAPLKEAIERVLEYDWLVFTSVNGVHCFLSELDRSRRDLRSLPGKICAIGPATQGALERFHLKVDVVAEEYVAEGLIAAIRQHNIDGGRVLIARAAEARDILPNELRSLGAQVDVVEAYRTLPPPNLRERAALVMAEKPDWIVFTSSSTVQNLVNAVIDDPLAAEHLRLAQTASIGPVTSGTLKKNGLFPAVEASPYTIAGLVQAIVKAGRKL